MIFATRIALCFVCIFSAITAHAEISLFDSPKEEFLKVEEAYTVTPVVKDGEILLDWSIQPGYFLYREKFKQQAVTSASNITLSPLYEDGLVKFDDVFNKEVELYYNDTRITASTQELPETFELKVKSQGCADAGLCYPPRSQYFEVNTTTGAVTEIPKSLINPDENQVSLVQTAVYSGLSSSLTDTSAAQESTSEKPKPESATKTNTNQNADSDSEHSLIIYLLLAIGGGMILNLMPCVFPVLSLKALSFASHAEGGHSHQAHGWAYTAGVIGSFIVIAIAILALRAAGSAAGWGFQLQSPVFVAAIAYLFLVMGLSLSGMIYFGTGLMGAGQNLTNSRGLKGSFFTGVLAAVVASPCTGPMMAPALGFALTQPPFVALLVFIALGFGLALPFLALSYSPALARMLPAPGTWMETLKQLLAFPMYITAAWLLYVYGNQLGMTSLFFLLLGSIGIVYAIWALQKAPAQGKGKWLAKGTAYLALIGAAYVAYAGGSFKKDESWHAFTPTIVQELREQGQPVFVDFTADWCITCKANEAVAINREEFKTVAAEFNYAKVKGDWTNEDPNITKVLTEYGRSGVPLYLVFPADTSKPAEVLPQLLTLDLVTEALKRNGQ